MRSYSLLVRDRARSLRKTSTDAERRLWRLLRARSLLPFKFRRQHPIDCYIVDFVCIEKRVVIELDGSQHLQQAAYDAERTRRLLERGYRVVRFWDDEVFLDTESVMRAIYNELNRPSP